MSDTSPERLSHLWSTRLDRVGRGPWRCVPASGRAAGVVHSQTRHDSASRRVSGQSTNSDDCLGIPGHGPAALLHAVHNTFIQGVFDPLTGDTGSTAYVIGEFGLGLALLGVIVGYVFWTRRAGLASQGNTAAPLGSSEVILPK